MPGDPLLMTLFPVSLFPYLPSAENNPTVTSSQESHTDPAHANIQLPARKYKGLLLPAQQGESGL